MSKTGRTLTEEHKRKIGEANAKALLGKKMPEETKLKISKIAKERGFGKWMTGKKLSPETILKKSLAQKGNKGSNWQGGKSTENHLIRNSSKYKEWRKKVFERDDYTCQICSKRGVKLNADHIKPYSLFPELRFDLNNGKTLCEPCHRNTPSFGKRIEKIKALYENGLQT